jgi:protein-S-isoprenylcysteine O-methyltransferase Ste14
MYLVLLKVPFSLLRTGLAVRTLTPPNKAPSDGDVSVRQGFERVTDVAVRYGPSVFQVRRHARDAHVHGLTLRQVFCVTEALAEMACIFATHMPSDTTSRVLPVLGISPSISPVTFAPSPIWAFGTAIAIAAGVFRLSTFRELGRYFTFQITIMKDHQLVTTGPFSVVRHPSYTGLLGVFWGSLLAQAAPGSWARRVLIDGALRDGFMAGPAWVPYARAVGAAVLVYELVSTIGVFDRVRREDTMLKKQFGEKWQEWATRTPYRLIPGLF